MITYVSRFRALLRLTIYGLPAAAFLLTYVVFSRGLFGINEIPRTGNVFYLTLITMVGWSVLADHYKVSSFEELFIERSGLLKCLQSCAIVFLFDAGVLVLSKTTAFSRVYLVSSVGLLLVLAMLTRTAFRAIAGAGVFEKGSRRVLIVGAGVNARRAAARLRNTAFGKYEVVAYLRLPDEVVKVTGAPVLEFADERLEQLSFEEIVIAVLPQQYSSLASLIRSLEGFCKPIRTVLDFGPNVVIRERMFQVGRLQLLDLGTTPAEGFAYSVVKRAFDIAFASAVILPLIPVLVVIAILVRLSSPGPILFRQVRVGMDGRHFEMLKFRTMRLAPQSHSDTNWRSEGDPRITPIGAFLRRTSLDELPQLFNVFRGDMSVVGPRPERPQFVSQFREQFERYNLRHRTKVGITGWAQVNGLRGDTCIKKRLKYDLYYQQNWSLALDFMIILMTVKVIITGENAY